MEDDPFAWMREPQPEPRPSRRRIAGYVVAGIAAFSAAGATAAVALGVPIPQELLELRALAPF